MILHQKNNNFYLQHIASDAIVQLIPSKAGIYEHDRDIEQKGVQIRLYVLSVTINIAYSKNWTISIDTSVGVWAIWRNLKERWLKYKKGPSRCGMKCSEVG